MNFKMLIFNKFQKCFVIFGFWLTFIGVVSGFPLSSSENGNVNSTIESDPLDSIAGLNETLNSTSAVPLQPLEPEYIDSNDTSTSTSNDTPSPSNIQTSVANLFSTLSTSFRNILETGQFGLLRAIGSVDKTLSTIQEGVQNSSFTVVLEGQKAAAKVYDLTPPQYNRIVQRLGSIGDTNVLKQLNQVFTQLRDNRKRFYDYWEEHEYDFHNVFQNVWSGINQQLGVPELPRMQLGWY